MAPTTSGHHHVSSAGCSGALSGTLGWIGVGHGSHTGFNGVHPSVLPQSVTASTRAARTSSPLSASSPASGRRGAVSRPSTSSPSNSGGRGALSAPTSSSSTSNGRRGAVSGPSRSATSSPSNTNRRGAVSGPSSSRFPAASRPRVAGPESQAYFADPTGASYHPSVLGVRNMHPGVTTRFNITGGVGASAHVGPLQRTKLSNGKTVLTREVSPAGASPPTVGSPLSTIQEEAG